MIGAVNGKHTKGFDTQMCVDSQNDSIHNRVSSHTCCMQTNIQLKKFKLGR